MLTDPRQLGMLCRQARGSNVIRSTKSARVHHVARRLGRRVVDGGKRAASGRSGACFAWPHPASASRNAADKINQFIESITSQIGLTTQLPWSAGYIDKRRFDAL